MMRTTKTSPSDLVTLLIETGSRRLVLVEGSTDVDVFDEWYLEREAELYFHTSGSGSIGVKNLVQQASDAGIPRVYGIIDRDFRTDVEVKACLADVASHLFILRRYCIENYLLESNAIHEELRVFYKGTEFDVPDTNTIQSDLLQICQNLGIAMAANWTLLDGAGAFLPLGFDLSSREVVVRYVSGQLKITFDEAEDRVSAKEALLAFSLTTMEDAHTCINGKFLLYRVHAHYSTVQRGQSREYLHNLLVRTIKAQGVHADIRTIVEDRILK